MIKKIINFIRNRNNKILNEEWLDENYIDLYEKSNLRISPERAYVLLEFLSHSMKNVQGDVIEMGVYKGSTAFLIADTMLKNNYKRNLFLCDTFEGTPMESENDNLFRHGRYSDTSLEDVENYLKDFSFIKYIKGFIPKSLDLISDNKFSVCHLHLNLYQSTKNALDFVYDRILSGGVIIVEDYGLNKCLGVKKAVDEFCLDNSCTVINLTTGQGVILKV